jgi:hypothetical protein
VISKVGFWALVGLVVVLVLLVTKNALATLSAVPFPLNPFYNCSREAGYKVPSPTPMIMNPSVS